ncbi:MAG: hypothetical protein VZQ55_06910 [Ruminococcus sp.]|nr:hypothetical protein [Ruminococcus sp.]
MKKTTRIASVSLAAMMAVSTLAVGTASVSAAAKVKKPTGVKAVNLAKGIKITWKKVKGAKKYQVFRGKKKIKTTKKKSYTLKKYVNGKTYQFSVRAVKGKKVSKKSKTVKIVRLAKPTFKSWGSVNNGAEIEWAKVYGAKKFYVYRDSKKIATTTKFKYRDTKVTPKKTYSYKIKAVNGKSTSVFSATVKVEFVQSPLLVTHNIEGDKVVLNWEKADGAKGYDVYVQPAGLDVPLKVGSTTETTFTDTIGVNPNSFEYTVVATGGTMLPEGKVAFVNIPDGSYKTDENGNLHVFITLKKDENGEYDSYIGGKAITDLLKKDDYAITIDEESAKYVNVTDGIITAVAPGPSTGTIKIELKGEGIATELYNNVCGLAGKDFGNKLTTGVVYVDVTVE